MTQPRPEVKLEQLTPEQIQQITEALERAGEACRQFMLGLQKMAVAVQPAWAALAAELKQFTETVNPIWERARLLPDDEPTE